MLMNGSGIPVIGMMPIVIPTFSKTWNTNIESTPMQIRVPSGSRASWAVRQIRHATTASSASKVPEPMNPSSSPTAVKMKSVCCSGTLPKRVWGPLNGPLPKKPPELIVTLACATLYPAPRAWHTDPSFWRNTVRRHCWYWASIPVCSTRTVPPSPMRVMARMWRTFAPPTRSIPMPTAANTSAVPRSGWMMISPIGSASTPRMTANRPTSSSFSKWATSEAIATITMILAGSDGSSWNPAIWNQACAPFDLLPTPDMTSRRRRIAPP